MLHFFDHVNWSEDTIEKNVERVKEFLNDHKFEYVIDPEGFDSLIIEIERKDFLEFASFLAEKLRAPLNCIHIVYQTLCVNGEGAFETMVDEEAKGFIEFAWNKKVNFCKPSQ
jgi:hypothetical protein